jgi:hypothetical protein
MSVITYPKLEVRRRFEPLASPASQWELVAWELIAYEATVWLHQGRRTDPCFSYRVACAPNFVRGLLRCYINDLPVNIGVFDRELQRIGTTRKEIERTISS